MMESLTITRDCRISGFGDVFHCAASLLSYILVAMDIIQHGHDNEDENDPESDKLIRFWSPPSW